MRKSGLALFLCTISGINLCAVDTAVKPFLEQHCIDCHDADAKKGGLDLEDLLAKPYSPATHKKWVRVYDVSASGEMPPAKKPRPEVAALKAFSDSLAASLKEEHLAQKGTVLRRLNRQEYENTVQQLLGIRTEVGKLLPEDGRSHHFDTVGSALSISSTQMQLYMDTASRVLDEALTLSPKPESATKSYTLNVPKNQEYFRRNFWLAEPNGSVVFFDEGNFPSTQVPQFKAKVAGRYRIKVTGSGYQMTEPLIFTLIVGKFDRGGDNDYHSFHELPQDQLGTVEMTLDLQESDGIKISPQNLKRVGKTPQQDAGGVKAYKGGGMRLKEVVIEGPLLEEWPPRGRKLLLGDVAVKEQEPSQPKLKKRKGYVPTYKVEVADPQAAMRQALPGFLQALFRRPLTETEILPYAQLFEKEWAQSQDYMTAMRSVGIAAMCSPSFLYLHEPQGQLKDHALATRLSYFLNRSTPDAELLRLAAAGQLSQAGELAKQTERLLKSPLAQRFIIDFTNGWLNLREIDFTTPDKILYPEYDPFLKDAMLRETRGFFRELVEKNLSTQNLIRSDFALLNQRLAEHYSLPAVSGAELQRVSLPADSVRGGVLTQASILKVSANGTNTSPVLRGVWVNERILGIEPQPPPPGVPGVEPDIRGAKTLRELLDKHRNMVSCQGCHSVIDPPGFALESFDVIGGWRDHFRSMGEGKKLSLQVNGKNVRYKQGPTVDASGEMPGGDKFQNIREFQQLLLTKKRDQVAHCLLEQLMTFATGREMGFSDREELHSIIAKTSSQQHGVRDLIHAIVQSSIFQHE
jgi:hypothetical protein